MMNKSEKLIKELNDEELRVLLLVFAYPKVLEAIKCYHTIPGYMRGAFIEPGRIEMQKRGIVLGQLTGEKSKLLEKRKGVKKC